MYVYLYTCKKLHIQYIYTYIHTYIQYIYAPKTMALQSPIIMELLSELTLNSHSKQFITISLRHATVNLTRSQPLTVL